MPRWPRVLESAWSNRSHCRAGSYRTSIATAITSLAENFRDDLPTRLTPMGVVDSPGISKDPSRRDFIDSWPPRSHSRAPTVAGRGRSYPYRRCRAEDIQDPERAWPRRRCGPDSSKEDVMVIGAHYDHDGEVQRSNLVRRRRQRFRNRGFAGNRGSFWNGHSRGPRAAFCCVRGPGEEKGLLGSRYYVNHPVFPLNRTVAMFQMDMIGRNEEHSANPAAGNSRRESVRKYKFPERAGLGLQSGSEDDHFAGKRSGQSDRSFPI